MYICMSCFTHVNAVINWRVDTFYAKGEYNFALHTL